MLTELDWILLSRNGYELFATLKILATQPDLFETAAEIGPTHSATADLCRRCWTYAGTSKYRAKPCCPICHNIQTYAKRFGVHAQDAIAIWGSVDMPAKECRNLADVLRRGSIVSYVHDDRHFLSMIFRRRLKTWIENILLYRPDMAGHLVIFPPRSNRYICTGDTMARILYAAPDYPTDRLWIYFYDKVFHLFSANRSNKQSVPIYDIGTFKGLLEAAAVFRSLLTPNIQEAVHELLHLKNNHEECFYWGRLLNLLKPEAVCMLEAWRFRHWPKSQLNLFFNLMNYVEYYSTDSDDSLSAGPANQ